MPLSRHFYVVDEVHAALSYRTTGCDCAETLFWCQELLLSGYASETISTLFESWLWYKGSFSLSWLITAERLACDEVTEDDIRLAAYQLSSRACSDHSLWNILVLTAMGREPERLTAKAPPYLPSDSHESYMVRAMFQGKAYSAWWMSRHLSDTRVWSLLRWYAVHNCPVYAERYVAALELLERYETLLGYSSPEYDVIVRCLAVLSLCLNAEQQAESWRVLPAEIGPLEIKSGRGYAIPTACLYGNCARGCMKWTESTVRQLGELEREMGDCPFWEEALMAYDLSSDSREDFYERYVPDIPDEWSAAEKQKSHGDGVLGPTEKVRLAKWARRFHTARLAWNTTSAVQGFLEACEASDTRKAQLEACEASDTRKAHFEVLEEHNTHKAQLDAIDIHNGLIDKTSIITHFPITHISPTLLQIVTRRLIPQ